MLLERKKKKSRKKIVQGMRAYRPVEHHRHLDTHIMQHGACITILIKRSNHSEQDVRIEGQMLRMREGGKMVKLQTQTAITNTAKKKIIDELHASHGHLCDACQHQKAELCVCCSLKVL